MAYVSYAYATDSPYYKSSVNDEISNYVDYLNNNTTGTNWYKWEFGQLPYDASDYDPDNDGQQQFIEDSLEYLDQEKSLVENENVVIAHGYADWGYGFSHPYTTSLGTSAYGATVYAETYVREREIRGFVWHEATHNYGAWHDDATYKVNGSEEMYDITPLTMSYLHNEDGQVDTTWEGGSDDPYEYCWGRDNYAWPYFEDRPERHDISRLSDCSLSEVQNWIDSHY